MDEDSIAGTELAQLYVALFGRAPDTEGLEYWTALREAGASLAGIADAMFATEPARAYFPAGMSAQDVTAALYRNVTGLDPDAEALAFWLGRLQAPGGSVGSMAVQLIDQFAYYYLQDAPGLRAHHFFSQRVSIAQLYAEDNGGLASAIHLFGGPAQAFPEHTVLALASDASGNQEAGGFAQLRVGRVAADVALQQVDAGAGLWLTGSPQPMPNFSSEYPLGLYHVVAYELADGTGAADAATLSLVSADRISARVAMHGVEYLFIEATDTDAVSQQPSYLDLLADQVRGITLSGNTGLTLGTDWTPEIRFVDASACSGTMSVWLHASEGHQVLLGGSGDDHLLRVDSPSSYIDGGDGDDLIVATRDGEQAPGVHTLTGGAGADRFELSYVRASGSFDVITDFNPGEGDVLMHPSFFWAGQWPASRVALGAGAVLEDYLHAAASGTADLGTAQPLLNWFQFGGDTYIVLDLNPALTFQFERTDGAAADQFIQLLGVLDLADLTLLHGRLALA